MTILALILTAFVCEPAGTGREVCTYPSIGIVDDAGEWVAYTVERVRNPESGVWSLVSPPEKCGEIVATAPACLSWTDAQWTEAYPNYYRRTAARGACVAQMRPVYCQDGKVLHWRQP